MQLTKVRRFKIKLADGSFVKTKFGDGEDALLRNRQQAHRKAKSLKLQDYTIEESIFLPAIYSWTVQMLTADGQVIELNEVPQSACEAIDYAIKEIFPDSF